MKDDTTSTHIVSIGSQDVLTEILKEGARDMLASAIENEVAEYIAQHADRGRCQNDQGTAELLNVHGVRVTLVCEVLNAVSS